MELYMLLAALEAQKLMHGAELTEQFGEV